MRVLTSGPPELPGLIGQSTWMKFSYPDWPISHFWNASGLSVQLGAEGVHVEVASLQALLSGGVAFDAARGAGPDVAQADAGTEFPLFPNFADAQASGYSTKQVFTTYFESSVRGLARGASVEFYGIQVGTVSEVALELNPATGDARVRVQLEVQPERITGIGQAGAESPTDLPRWWSVANW